MRARITSFAWVIAFLVACNPSRVIVVAPMSIARSVASKRAPACIAYPSLDAWQRLGAIGLDDIERDLEPLGDLDGDGQDDVALFARSQIGNHQVGPRALYLSRGGCTAFAGVVDNPVAAAATASTIASTIASTQISSPISTTITTPISKRRLGVRDVLTFFPNEPCGSYTLWIFDGAKYVPAVDKTCTCDPAGDDEPTCVSTAL